MAVTLNQLASFLAVAREGSVSAAAEKLYVTQPSISAAVSALSREIGVDLTERVGRGIGLTAAGDAFRPYAADVLGLIEQGRKAAREAADVSMRSLRIVAVATAAEFVVPSLLRAFGKLHPEINLALEVANRASLFDRVLEHEVDVAIAGRPPDDERIAGRAFLKNEIVLIVAPDDPLAGATSVPPGAARRPRLADARARLGHAPARDRVPRRARPPAADADARLERRDQGGRAARSRRLAPVPRRRRARAQRNGTIGEIGVRGGLPRREWYALHSATVPPRPAVELFLDFANGPEGRRAFEGRE